MAGTNRPIATNVQADVEIDLACLVGGWDDRYELKYTLVGFIVWKGRTVDRGHYVAYLREQGNYAVKLDDAYVSRALSQQESKSGLLKLALYVRNDCLKNKDGLAESLSVLADAKTDMELILKGHLIRTCFIGRSDLHLANSGHYAIMAVYTRIKLMVLADSINFSASRDAENIFMVCTSLMMSFNPAMTVSSFFTDWTLVHTNEIEQQNDGVSCGALCCLNAYRFLMRDVVCSVSDKCRIVKLRYWIATVARMANVKACRKNVSKPHSYKKICADYVKNEIKRQLPDEVLWLDCGHQSLKVLSKKDIFQQVKAIEEEHARCTIDSGSSDVEMAVDDEYGSLIQRPHVLDLALLQTCCEDLRRIDSFSDPLAAEQLDSERLKALQEQKRSDFIHVSTIEIGEINDTLHKLKMSNDMQKEA